MSNIIVKKCLSYFLFLLLFLNVFVSLPVYLKVNAEGYIPSKAECVMELNSRRILYETNGDVCLPMASTTKILTAITIIEQRKNLDEVIEIPIEAEGIEGSSVYLKAGEKYSIKDLLYGLMLRSGNDCATALAIHHSDTISSFSARMNEIAQKAGAIHSSFQNPHGLPDKNHYTTARDLSNIACYAMQNPIFSEIVSTKFYQPHNWKNKNKMLQLCDGGLGIKTGYTKEAGRCLVSAAQRDSMTLICTVLNSPNMYERSMQLLNDAFSAYKYKKIIEKGQIFKISNQEEKGMVMDDFFYPILEDELNYLEIKTEPISSKRNLYKKNAKSLAFSKYIWQNGCFFREIYINYKCKKTT